jgi:hypothetical protein
MPAFFILFMKKYFVAALVFLSCLCTAQTTSIPLQRNYAGLRFEDFVKSIESNSQFVFFWNSDWTSNIKIKQSAPEESLHQVLIQSLAEAGLDYIILEKKFIIIVDARDVEAATTVDKYIDFTLSGTVKDNKTYQPIPFATITIPGVSNEVVTDKNGNFSISLRSGYYLLNIDAPGYTPIQKSIRHYGLTKLEIGMFEKMIELREIEVSTTAMQNIQRLELGVQKLNTDNLKSIPPLLGEIDVIRSILSLPGVKTVGEGASGFNVRGGNVDQNLILVDDAPLFNSSHLFGLFSVVNSDVVTSMTLQKASMPARYGGRLSSVLDIQFDERIDLEKPIVDASLGVMSSKFKLSLPVQKNKTALTLSARAAYPDWLLNLVPDQSIRQSSANFYDATIKIAHRIDEKNFITATTHLSSDEFRLGVDTTYGWSAYTASARWMRQHSEKVYSKLSGFYSKNQNEVYSEHPINGFTLRSSIINAGLNYDFAIDFSEKHQLEIGIQSSFYKNSRATLSLTQDDNSLPEFNIPAERGVESSVYLSDVFNLNSTIAISGGLRLSSFMALGKGKRRIYADGLPRNEATWIGEEPLPINEIEKSFVNAEPRLNVKFSINSESSIKAGYSRNFQYLSLLSNTMAVSPVDTWKLADYYTAPQESEQVSLGFFKNFNNADLEFSTELYVKRFSNITQYKDGAKLLMNERIEMDLLQGTGKAYGAEFYLKKNTGKLTGWASYTYSRSFVKVEGDSEEETLSGGEYFPSNFDKPNDVSFILSYSVSSRITASCNFVYSTGRPITYPESIYVVDGYVVSNYSKINQARIPDYHRLDCSITHNMLKRKSRKVETSWSLGAYNVYARKNPFSVFFRPMYSGRYPQAYIHKRIDCQSSVQSFRTFH